MNKIYFIRLSKTKFGGAENYLRRLSKIANNSGYSCKIINSSLPKFFPGWFKVVLFNLYLFLTKGNKTYFSLDRIVCPDIYRAGDGVHKAFIEIEKKSKLNPLHPIYLYIEKKCFKNAKLIFANSEMIKNQIIKYYNIPPKKIKVLHNGIEFPIFNFYTSQKKILTELSSIENCKIILFVGSGYKRKGLEEFLKIVSKITYKNMKAIVIGKDKSIEKYKKIAADLRIIDKVIFLGPRVDVNDFYTISDIFILPTKYEPFSNSVLEAMYFRNAVFTSIYNGASEILPKESVVSFSEIEDVAHRVENILIDDSKLESLKEMNHRLSKNFSIEKNLHKVVESLQLLEKNKF